MQQLRIFIGLEGDTARLSKEINDWLRDSKVKVTSVFGNIAPQAVLNKGEPQKLGAEQAGRRFAASDILVVVVYDA